MRTIEKVHVFRCVGKVDGKIITKVNVVAGGHRHAERTCILWLKEKNASLASSIKFENVQWQCKLVKVDNPIYMEWEDGS